MLTAKNRDQLRNPTLGNRVLATFIFLLNLERFPVGRNRKWRYSKSFYVTRRSSTATAYRFVAKMLSLENNPFCCTVYDTVYVEPGPYLRGGLRVQPPPPRNVEKKFFWQCIKARPAKCERWRTLCLHYCDARKSHLASIKCKKPLGRPGLRPRPYWGSLQRSPRPPSRWGGGWLPSPQERHPRFRPFRPHLSPPPNF